MYNIFYLIKEIDFSAWSLGSMCRVSPGLADLYQGPYTPPGTKDLKSVLFSLAKTLPKHTTALSHTQNSLPNEGLAEQLGAALVFMYSFWF